MSRILDEQGNVIATNVEYATNFWDRYKGLMHRKPQDFPQGNALFFDKCGSIHMFFMKFPIDVIYLDKDFKVVKIVRAIKPWRVDFGHPQAYYTIELNANTLNKDYNPNKIYIE